MLLGTPASNEYVFGVEFNDGTATPFVAYDISYVASGTLQADSSSVSLGIFSGNWAAPTNVVIDAAVTVDEAITGNMLFYGNGALQTTTAVGLATIDYGASPQLNMGGTSNAGQNAANARHLVGYTWNRVLSAAEVMSLHSNPYQLFTWTETFLGK